jgi:hypothetical protein
MLSADLPLAEVRGVTMAYPADQSWKTVIPLPNEVALSNAA